MKSEGSLAVTESGNPDAWKSATTTTCTQYRVRVRIQRVSVLVELLPAHQKSTSHLVLLLRI